MAHDPSAPDPEHDSWPVHEQSEEYEFVGIDAQNLGVFYEPESHSTFRGRLNEEHERVDRVEGSDESLAPEETVGEYVERVGDELGWERLSSFARDHLESESDGG